MTEHLRHITGRGVVIIIVAIGIVVYSVQPLMLPFVIAGVLAFICTPLVNLIRSWTGVWRALAAAAVFIAVIVAIGAFGYFTLPQFSAEALRVLTNLDDVIKSAFKHFVGGEPITIFGQPLNADELAKQINDSLRSWITQPSHMLTIAGLSFASLIGSILTIVLFAYMLFDGPRIERGVFLLVPPLQRPFAHHLWRRLEPALRRYFIGLALVVVYASVAAYIGLALFLQLPHAVLLAVMTGFLELIPFVGPFAAALLAGMIAIQNAQGIGSIIAYAIYATALRLSIDQIVAPLVVGAAARIHPVLVIFCLLVGGYLFGVIGVLLAVPFAVTIKIVLATLYEE